MRRPNRTCSGRATSKTTWFWFRFCATPKKIWSILVEDWRDAMKPISRQCRLYAGAILHREFAGWLWDRIWRNDIIGRAAKLSYYLLLAVFPLLICLSAVLGYFFAAETRMEDRLLEYLRAVMPRTAFDVLKATMDELLRTRGGGKLSAGLLGALWLASSGMEALIDGLNVAYQVAEVRPWWKRRLVALGLTVAVALAAGGALGLVLVGGRGGRQLWTLVGLAGAWTPFWRAAQWVGCAVFLLCAISLVYWLGPGVKGRRSGQVIWPGALAALACWLAASAALRIYLDHFSSYGRTYGSLGAVIALLAWLHLTGATLLLGAEINSGIQARLGRTPA